VLAQARLTERLESVAIRLLVVLEYAAQFPIDEVDRAGFLRARHVVARNDLLTDFDQQRGFVVCEETKV
jgi:hypothetical protein